MTIPARSAEAAAADEAAEMRLPSFEEFYEAHHRRLFVSLCLVTGDRQEAEEVMQEAFVRVWERWDKVGRLDAPTGYLYRAARG
jgi:DNA-directed RNA polymerase specialized sigma24 family protein